MKDPLRNFMPLAIDILNHIDSGRREQTMKMNTCVIQCSMSDGGSFDIFLIWAGSPSSPHWVRSAEKKSQNAEKRGCISAEQAQIKEYCFSCPQPMGATSRNTPLILLPRSTA
jgi:hypothetical protein